jgi:hypothetical protein
LPVQTLDLKAGEGNRNGRDTWKTGSTVAHSYDVTRGGRKASAMQREKTAVAFDQDLKEAISDVKRQEYRRELLVALNSAALRTIDHKVRSDSQLTMNDRLQLLSEIEQYDTSAS